MLDTITDVAKDILGCDAARVLQYDGKFFLLVGINRHSSGEWLRNGEPVEFDYTEEHCVASGDTEAELSERLYEYARIKDLTMEEYLTEAWRDG